ncbi:hypothetical protein [Serratia marcescens]|uniref:Uncharacterized protein n=1 Tax=Serratia marcescens TaxID=615 RepID=A0AAP8PI10_SERMA|nr:hypothetical protein [Serratia marcescens]PNO65037.1 hypothetical protein MC70_017690 [Serratia marcescens]
MNIQALIEASKQAQEATKEAGQANPHYQRLQAVYADLMASKDSFAVTPRIYEPTPHEKSGYLSFCVSSFTGHVCYRISLNSNGATQFDQSNYGPRWGHQGSYSLNALSIEEALAQLFKKPGILK